MSWVGRGQAKHEVRQDGDYFQLTAEGVSNIRCTSTLANPQRAAAVRRNLALQHCTLYELVCHAQEAGWTSVDLKWLSKRDRKAWLTSCYSSGQDKVYVVNGDSIVKPYLLALLTYDKHRKDVIHGAKASVYLELLGIEQKAKKTRIAMPALSWMEALCYMWTKQIRKR